MSFPIAQSLKSHKYQKFDKENWQNKRDLEKTERGKGLLR